MTFYEELISYSPFFMGELAKKLSVDDEEVDRVYKKIYMQIRYYHKLDWKCEKIATGKKGRRPLRCMFVGVKK